MFPKLSHYAFKTLDRQFAKNCGGILEIFVHTERAMINDFLLHNVLLTLKLHNISSAHTNCNINQITFSNLTQ